MMRGLGDDEDGWTNHQSTGTLGKLPAKTTHYYFRLIDNKRQGKCTTKAARPLVYVIYIMATRGEGTCTDKYIHRIYGYGHDMSLVVGRFDSTLN